MFWSLSVTRNGDETEMETGIHRTAQVQAQISPETNERTSRNAIKALEEMVCTCLNNRIGRMKKTKLD